MKIRLLFIGLVVALIATNAKAQEAELTDLEKLEQRTEALESAVQSSKKFKVSGYVQTQLQVGQPDAAFNTNMKSGGPNNDLQESYNRFGIRRGRIKFTYEEGIASGVFQLDITEKGVGFKDAYINIKDPWVGTSALKSGMFDRTFGYEISYSSSKRESPERSMIFQTLFPDERDLGVAVTLAPAKTSPFSFLHLDMGLFSGSGIKPEIDNRMDFIGHLYASGSIGNHLKYGAGLSYYNGGVLQGSKNVYTMDGNAFVLNNDSAKNFRKSAKREYFGIDGQLNLITKAGMTKLHAEYLFGQQPGTKASSKSPNTGVLLSEILAMNPSSVANDTYIRNFSGGYVMFTQDLGALPLTAILKYDWYDPNTNVSGEEVGQNGTGIADLAQNTFGFGALWRINNALRLTAYYEVNSLEKTDKISYKNNTKTLAVNNLERNVFTMRLQYKF